MTTAEYFHDVVTEKGWMAVGNIYFDNALTLFPFTCDGRVCYSPAKEMFFALEKHDSTNTQLLEGVYITHDDRYHSLYQTIVCIGAQHLQHFTLNLFNFSQHTPSGISPFPVPTIPKPADIDAMTPDAKTGLYAGTDTVEYKNQKQGSTICLYPDETELAKYYGIRVDSYKMFNKNHLEFCKAVNKFFGTTDCI